MRSYFTLTVFTRDIQAAAIAARLAQVFSHSENALGWSLTTYAGSQISFSADSADEDFESTITEHDVDDFLSGREKASRRVVLSGDYNRIGFISKWLERQSDVLKTRDSVVTMYSYLASENDAISYVSLNPDDSEISAQKERALELTPDEALMCNDSIERSSQFAVRGLLEG